MTTSIALSTAIVTACPNKHSDDENDTSSQFNICDESGKHDGEKSTAILLKNLRNHGLRLGSVVGFINGCLTELCIGLTYEVTNDLVPSFLVGFLALLIMAVQRVVLSEYIETHVASIVFVDNNRASDDSDSDADETPHEDRGSSMIDELVLCTRKYEFCGYLVGLCIGSTIADVLMYTNVPILPPLVGLSLGGAFMWVPRLSTRNDEELFRNQKESFVMSQSHVPLLSQHQTIALV